MSECPHGYPAADVHRCAICRRNSATPTFARAVYGTWADSAKHALTELVGAGRPFTSEDLTDLAGLPGESRANGNNAVGAFIQSHASLFGLRRVGMERARNPQAHGRLLQVWVGRA